MFAKWPHRYADPSGFDVVGGIADEHRRLDDLGAEILQLGANFRPAHEPVHVTGAAHFAEHPNGFGELVAAALAEDGELALADVDRSVDNPLIERCLWEKNAVFDARHGLEEYTSQTLMGVLEAAARIVQLGGEPDVAARVAAMRSTFEAETGEFAPEDAWFEERSRAFWADAVTRGRFGRHVAPRLMADEARWLVPFERAHRGLFRAEGRLLVDVWSGAEIALTVVDDESRAELDAAGGQLFDARVVGADDPIVIALLPGAIFHPRQATTAIESVLVAAEDAALPTHAVLDALLRMERSFRALTRVKPAYAYRADALWTEAAGRRRAQRI